MPSAGLFLYLAMTHLAGAIVTTAVLAGLLMIKAETDSYVWSSAFMVVGALSYAAGSFALGGFSDRHGRPLGAGIGMAVVGAAAGIVVALPGLAGLMAFMALGNVGLALFFTSAEGFVADQPTPGWNIVRKASVYNVSWCSGDIVGSLIGTSLVGISTRLPFIVALGLSALCVAAVAWEARRSQSAAASAPRGERPSCEPEGSRRADAALFAMAGRVGLFFGAAAAFLVMANVIKYAMDRGLSSGTAGAAVAFMFISELAVFFGMGRAQFWRGKPTLQVLLHAVMIAGCLGIAVAGDAASLIAATAVLGAGYAFTYTFSLAYSLDLSEESRSKQGGIHEAAIGLGSAVGPIVAGAMAACAVDARLLFVAGAALVACSVAAQVILFAGGRRVRGEVKCAPGDAGCGGGKG